jgi:hypothetical protein
LKTAIRSARGTKSFDSGVVTRVTKSTIDRSAGVSFHAAIAEVPDIARAGREACAVPLCGVLAQAQRTTTVNPIQHLRINQIMKAPLVCDVVWHVIFGRCDSLLPDITFGAPV